MLILRQAGTTLKTGRDKEFRGLAAILTEGPGPPGE